MFDANIQINSSRSKQYPPPQTVLCIISDPDTRNIIHKPTKRKHEEKSFNKLTKDKAAFVPWSSKNKNEGERKGISQNLSELTTLSWIRKITDVIKILRESNPPPPPQKRFIAKTYR